MQTESFFGSLAAPLKEATTYLSASIFFLSSLSSVFKLANVFALESLMRSRSRSVFRLERVTLCSLAQLLESNLVVFD